jgi:hypothetical protein
MTVSNPQDTAGIQDERMRNYDYMKREGDKYGEKEDEK